MQNPCDKVLEAVKNFLGDTIDIRINSAVIKNGEVTVNLICDSVVSEGDKNLIKSSFENEFSAMPINLNFSKSIADAEICKTAVFNYLQTHCFSVAHAIDKNSVKIISGGKKIKYEIVVLDTVKEYLERTGVIPSLNEYLHREYCNLFEGEIRASSHDESAPTLEDYSVLESDVLDLQQRKVKMAEVVRFCDDEFYDTATYIQDGKEVLGKCYFAGTVVEKEERVSKKGNTYYRLTLDDKSSKISGSYFTSDKQKLQKLQKIDVGSVIIARGEMDEFGGRTSFIIKGYHLCEFPSGYKPQPRPSKKPPEKYTYAFPTPCETSKQDDFFTSSNTLPKWLTEKEYVVVDIETTGTDVTSDKITEIGAVRIKNGVIRETFQILIDPEVSLSKRIVELTGITDEMLVGKPKIQDAYPDFIKFLGDAVFVAHNADFDYRFLKNAGKPLGYYIENECVDTLEISRKKLPWLSNHKLNTVCGHFNIEFRHHRALSDAFATAEALIELAKL